jgi:hypothetical protein
LFGVRARVRVVVGDSLMIDSIPSYSDRLVELHVRIAGEQIAKAALSAECETAMWKREARGGSHSPSFTDPGVESRQRSEEAVNCNMTILLTQCLSSSRFGHVQLWYHFAVEAHSRGKWRHCARSVTRPGKWFWRNSRAAMAHSGERCCSHGFLNLRTDSAGGRYEPDARKLRKSQ